MGVPSQVKIKRIGLVLEMADGSKVMVYADDLTHAEAVIQTETPVGVDPWDPWQRRRPIGPPETSITITGIEAYRIQWTDADARTSNAGRELEAMRRAVQ